MAENMQIDKSTPKEREKVKTTNKIHKFIFLCYIFPKKENMTGVKQLIRHS